MEEKRKVFDWIDNILRKNDFQTVDVMGEIERYIKDLVDGTEYSCALYESNRRCVQYVLVLDMGKADLKEFDLGNKQRNLYRNLQELGDRLEPEFDKNVSLLLCVEGNIANEELEKEILRIEENPYCFKKLVLVYSEEELRGLENNTEIDNLWDFMNHKLKMLTEGKTESDKEVEFILKLLIKMPFLSVDVIKEYNKKNLMEEIEDNLDDKDKIVWKDIKDMELAEVEGIKKYTEEQIDNILDKWYKEGKKE